MFLQHHAGNFIKKETLAQVLCCKFCEIIKSTFFWNTSGWLLFVKHQMGSDGIGSGLRLFWVNVNSVLLLPNYVERSEAANGGVLLKIGVLKYVVNFIGKHTCSLFNTAACHIQGCNLIKKWLQHRCLPGKFAKFLRKHILKKICEQLHLSIAELEKKAEITPSNYFLYWLFSSITDF